MIMNMTQNAPDKPCLGQDPLQQFGCIHADAAHAVPDAAGVQLTAEEIEVRSKILGEMEQGGPKNSKGSPNIQGGLISSRVL